MFAIVHLLTTRKRKNRRAVLAGYAVFVSSAVLLFSGLLLMRVGGFELKTPAVRSGLYWAHVVAPLVVGWLYWLHRLAGPPIKWRFGLWYTGVVGTVVVGMVLLHSQDPRQWHRAGPSDGEQYFQPSLARTTSGKFIPASTLMRDQYCRECHADVHAGWTQSVHHLSSFNNPAYLASVMRTRDVLLKRDGNVHASRWCAGCHDPVPFFSGAFDDPDFDVLNHPTANAGVTCTVCHAITNINGPLGNADYTIEEPEQYPFAFSTNPVLKWISNQLVKAKPEMHKKTFLKEFHKSAEFCSVCHKVHLPYALNQYKEFLRGQNHYDSYLLSGVSGHGAQSFYYPPQAETNCNGCHMPLQPSDDFGARPRLLSDTKQMTVHDHLFPSANTALAWLRDKPDVVRAQQEFLKGVMRVDIFGVKENGTIDGRLHAPLRPEVPALTPGKRYLLEAVVRTLKMGHQFTQGTTDSNEIWLDVTATSGGRVIARSGGRNANGEVDPWSFFVNAFILDRHGNRIARRNPEDIFVKLYDHQIPPGAARTAHYLIHVPDDLKAPVTVTVKLQYRKFDQTYMDFVAQSLRKLDRPIRGDRPGRPYHNELPITTLAADRITFPIAGQPAVVSNTTPEIPIWQRWNDYGIGLFLEGKAELRQAADAFAEVEKLKRYDGPLNLARVLEREGRLDEAVAVANRAAMFHNPAAPRWTLAWLSGRINRQQGFLEKAADNLRSVLEDRTEEMRRRKFDFSQDYRVNNLLGETLFDLAKRQRGPRRAAVRRARLNEAVAVFRRTLTIDPENVAAHYNLQLLYAELGETAKSDRHRRLHERYKPDDNARGNAVRLARQKYPAANHAAESLVIYDLQRVGAPGLGPSVAVGKATPPGKQHP